MDDELIFGHTLPRLQELARKVGRGFPKLPESEQVAFDLFINLLTEDYDEQIGEHLLVRYAKNRMSNMVRDRARRPVVPIPEDTPAPDVWERTDERIALRQALSQLSPESLAALEAVAEELNIKQAAKKLGVTARTLQRRLKPARERAKELLGEDLPEPVRVALRNTRKKDQMMKEDL